MANPIDLGTLFASIEVRTSRLEQTAKQATGVFDKMATDIGKISDTLNKKLELQTAQAAGAAERRAAATLESHRRQVTQFASEVGRNMTIAGAAITLPMGAAIKKAADFDQAMANTNSLLKLSDAGFQDLKKSIMGVADDPKIRQGPVDLARGMYDIASSGFSGAKAIDILRVSAIGASAGMTDTATSSRALMAVLNSGIGGVNNAKEAMDVLFRAVDRGVFTFGELAGSIGDVLPTAKIMKVDIQEVTAALATMTKQGLNVAEAQTALNNLLVHVAKPGKEAKDKMDELGISYGVTAMEGKGLAGWLQEVIDKTHGNTQEMIKLMPELRGMKGELLLAGDGLKKFRSDTEAATNASKGQGAAIEALNKQNAGAIAQYELLKKQIEILSVNIGSKLLPMFRDMLTQVKAGVEWFDKLPEGVKNTTAQIALLGGVTLIAGGQLLGMAANAATLIARLKELGAIPFFARLMGDGGVGGLADKIGVPAAALYFSTQPEDPTVTKFRDYMKTGRGPSPSDDLRNDIWMERHGLGTFKGDAEEQRMLRSRVAPAAVKMVRPIGNAKAIDPEEAKARAERVKDIARANREAQIEVNKLSADAAKRELAAQQEADDEFKKMVNEDGVAINTAGRVRAAKYKEAHDAYLKEIVAAGVKAYEAETAALEKQEKVRDDAATAVDAFRQGLQEMERNASEVAQNATGEADPLVKMLEQWANAEDIKKSANDLAEALKQWDEAVSNVFDYAEIHAKQSDNKPPSVDDIMEDAEATIGVAKQGADAKTVKDDILTTRQLLKGLQRDASQVFSGLFEDLLSGHKNPFRSFADAFKSMLIKMAAEFAASKLMQMLGGMFSGIGGKKGGLSGIAGASGIMQGESLGIPAVLAGMFGMGGGGGGLGSIVSILSSFIPGGGLFGGLLGGLFGGGKGKDGGGIGGLLGGVAGDVGGIFGFADGGRPPVGRFSLVGERGPELVKFDRGATVFPSGVMPTGVDEAGGGGMNFHGDIHIHGVKDVAGMWRELGEHGRRMDRFRRGTG